MFRTALVGTAIAAGLVVGGCKEKSNTPASGTNQSTPPAVQKPAEEGSKAAGNLASENNSEQTKINDLASKIKQELKDLKIDDAANDLKTLQGMKDKMSAAQQQDLTDLTNDVDKAQHAAHALPTTMPAH